MLEGSFTGRSSSEKPGKGRDKDRVVDRWYKYVSCGLVLSTAIRPVCWMLSERGERPVERSKCVLCSSSEFETTPCLVPNHIKDTTPHECYEEVASKIPFLQSPNDQG